MTFQPHLQQQAHQDHHPPFTSLFVGEQGNQDASSHHQYYYQYSSESNHRFPELSPAPTYQEAAAFPTGTYESYETVSFDAHTDHFWLLILLLSLVFILFLLFCIDTPVLDYYWARFYELLTFEGMSHGLEMNENATQQENATITTKDGDILAVGDYAILRHNNGLNELVKIQGFERGGMAAISTHTQKSQFVLSSHLKPTYPKDWMTWESLKERILQSQTTEPNESDVACSESGASVSKQKIETDVVSGEVKANEKMKSGMKENDEETMSTGSCSVVSAAGGDQSSKKKNTRKKNNRKKKKKGGQTEETLKETSTKELSGEETTTQRTAAATSHADHVKSQEIRMQQQSNYGRICNNRSCLKGGQTSTAKRVSWQNVHLREYARCVGGSGGVPGSGSWPLGLSNEVVVRSTDDPNASELVDVFASQSKQRDVDCTIAIDEFESQKEKLLEQRRQTIDPKLLRYCTGESRQFSHRKHSNPLFDRLVEPSRATAIQSGVYCSVDAPGADMDASREDFVQMNSRLDEHNSKETDELASIRSARDASGCNCRHISSKAKNYNRLHLQTELASRNVSWIYFAYSSNAHSLPCSFCSYQVKGVKSNYCNGFWMQPKTNPPVETTVHVLEMEWDVISKFAPAASILPRETMQR
eukprot:gb/GECG01012612.1/.p1 GENE.gb/GECG01012612.1/~~gb/GECG01012612.1/.p1  ORF type:complete len:647 (+),score=81.75 gb/GECG01012612.1/:1-1941(+)